MAKHQLFPSASKAEIERTRFWLEKYVQMIDLMKDYERYKQELQQVTIDGEVARRIDQEDLHADKTANAVVLLEKQRWVYEQYSFFTDHLQRAAVLIQDEDARKAVDYRYIQGHRFKDTAIYFSRSIGDASTVRRKINRGIENMADTLMLLGFFEHDTEF